MDFWEIMLAREMAGGSGGTAIDLREYAIPDSTSTISDAVLEMALMGGGAYVVAADGMEQFWIDVVAKQPTHLVFDVGGSAVRIIVGALMASSYDVAARDAVISATGTIMLYGESLEGTFILAQHGTGVKAFVKADPVVFPELSQ